MDWSRHESAGSMRALLKLPALATLRSVFVVGVVPAAYAVSSLSSAPHASMVLRSALTSVKRTPQSLVPDLPAAGALAGLLNGLPSNPGDNASARRSVVDLFEVRDAVPAILNNYRLRAHLPALSNSSRGPGWTT